MMIILIILTILIVEKEMHIDVMQGHGCMVFI